MQFWNELEGQTIDGRHPLRRLVRSEGRSAWFESETGDPKSTPSTISLTEALTDADEVTARLTAAQQLKHPNLVSITKVGQVTLDNTLFVYAVMEHIEQSLSDVLQSQALSPEEGREVAEALVGSLTAIHQNGMSHGHVEAASVLATEETVKLRSDCLQISPANQAEDVAGIGATLFQAFTQRKPLTATDAQINRIPAPFAEIIRNSFARRWTLAQINNALKPVLPVATPIPPPPAPARPPVAPPSEPVPVKDAVVKDAVVKDPVVRVPVVGVPVVKEPVKAPPVAPRLSTPPIPAVTPLPVTVEEEEKPVGAKKVPYALYGGVAVVVLAIIGWLFLRPASTPTPAGASPAQTQVVTPPPLAPVKPSAATPVPSARRPVKPSVAPPAASAPAPEGRSVWRVVAYTYKGQTKAADMVAKINEKHSDLAAEVYSPRSGDYLVTVGGAMDHDEATKVLDKARRMGLPADSYVQNFSR